MSARPLRADAERNRRRILAAAAELFADRGLAASLDDVAVAAGVGVGTVYRRFPDKDALIDALFEDNLRDIERIAGIAQAIEDPWQAFATFTRELCAFHARDRGLKEAMLSDEHGRERARRARELIAPVGNRLLQRAQEAGAVRADLAPTDLPLIHLAVGFVAEKTRCVTPDAWERVLTVVLDGLAPRRDATTPILQQPLAPEDLPAVLARKRR